MKKTHKKVFGILGLSLVAGMTVMAATIPNPGASATSNVTDTIQVRVVGNQPDVAFDPTMPKAVADPEYEFSVEFKQIDDLIVTSTNEDAESYLISNTHEDYNEDYDNLEKLFDVSEYYGDYAYGTYNLTATGTGVNGGWTDTWDFTYYPIVVRQQDDGTYKVEVDDNPAISKTTILITGKQESGKEVTIGPVDVKDGVDLSSYGLTNGGYLVTVTAYNKSGETIFRSHVSTYTVTGVPDTGAPDTGGIFGNLDISKEDYLVTGLIVFFVLGIVALGIVIKGRGAKTSKRR